MDYSVEDDVIDTDSLGPIEPFQVEIDDEAEATHAGAGEISVELIISPPPLAVQESNFLASVVAEDTKIANSVLNNLREGWNAAESVEDICKLSLTTLKALEMRRNLMNLQLGREKFVGSGQGGMGPYDA